MSPRTRPDPARSLVLITGGTRGIGAILARAIAEVGHPVLLTGRSAEKAVAAAATLAAETGAVVRGTRLDVADTASIEALATEVRRLEAELDVGFGALINNAGVVGGTEAPVWEVPAEEIDEVLTTNLIGPFHLVRVLAPILLEHCAADALPRVIIDLNSGSGSRGTPALAAYSASKTGLFRLGDAVHVHGHEHGLRVFEMAPGVIRSDMTASMPMHDDRTDDEWTDPKDLAELALALLDGRLDAYAGRFVRAGADTPASLLAEAPELSRSARRLGLMDQG